MLQETILRLDGIDNLSPPIVVCNEEHRFLVAEHSRQISRPPQSIILEPIGRNTAPALTLAALSLQTNSEDDDPVMLVLSADHVITDVPAFQTAIVCGLELASQGCVVTFGIVPTGPKTGYGYLRKGPVHVQNPLDSNGSVSAYELANFVEKPTESKAIEMLDTGEYLWNSGMFVMKVSIWLEQLEKFRPDIAESCRKAHKGGEEDGVFYRPEPEEFATCPTDTIDYAVMERITENSSDGPASVVVPLDAGWSDVGAWSALLEVQPRDENGNVIQGDVYTHNVKDSLVVSQHRLVAAIGLENVIVVETADAVLVAHTDHVEDVKEVAAQLKQEKRYEQENHRKVHRPWGWYETLDSGPGFQVKRITVNPGAALSLQMHHHRAEHWVVVRGTAKIIKGNEESYLHENESAFVPIGEQHRLENPGSIPLEIIEVQSGSYLGEDDIVRFEDRYNRVK
jgi:mannose-1-phosphate guanylyltransferase/mannose-6-phosphate isomerase